MILMHLFTYNFTDSTEADTDTLCDGHVDSPLVTGIMTNANEILELINKLTSTMLKLTVGQVVKPLTILFNQPLSEGKIPDDWKRPMFFQFTKPVIFLLSKITNPSHCALWWVSLGGGY